MKHFDLPEFISGSSDIIFSMRENKLKIAINKSASEVFEFVLNPKNTPLWISSIIKEEVNEKPTKLGTIYRNVNKNGIWSEYLVLSFDENRMFEMISQDKNYHVRYTLKKLGDNFTELKYLEWVDNGDIAEPFTLDILKKLKTIIEKS